MDNRKEGCSDKASTIAHNVAIDHLPSAFRPAWTRCATRKTRRPSSLCQFGPSLFERVAAIEDKVQIQAALDQLPPIFREVLMLRFQEQMKLEEIAKLINIPLATVKTRIYGA